MFRPLDGFRGTLAGREPPRPEAAAELYTHSSVGTVARRLLGQLLVVPTRSGRVSGIIVETEAYRGPEDRASHAWGGRRTLRTETMYARGGTAYVYFVYGMYFQFNVVTGVADVPHAVLVRAVEPVEGVALMRRRRGGGTLHGLTSGPGKLCIALGITGGSTGLLGTGLDRARPPAPARAIAAGPRVGIDYAEAWVDRRWRFWLRDNPFVSRSRAGVRRGGGARSGGAPT